MTELSEFLRTMGPVFAGVWVVTILCALLRPQRYLNSFLLLGALLVTLVFVAGLFGDIRKKCESSEISTKALDLRGLIAAIGLTRQGLNLGQALELGITNKSFDEFERQLVADLIAARIRGDLGAGQLFAQS